MDLAILLARFIGFLAVAYLVGTIIYVFVTTGYNENQDDNVIQDRHKPRIRPFSREQLERLNKFV